MSTGRPARRTEYRACPHCQRVTAVVSAAGRLARHSCRVNVETMTPAEQVAAARSAESNLRAMLTFAHGRTVEHALRARRIRAVGYPLAAALVALGVVLTLTVGPGPASGGVWLVLAALTIGGRVAHGRAVDGAALYASKLRHLEPKWSAAFDQLLELEATHPDVDNPPS